MNGEEMRAIGRIEAAVEAMNDRMDRSEAARADHHREIYERLGKLESAAQFNKGRMSWIGWLFTVVGVAISATVGAVVAKFMGG